MARKQKVFSDFSGGFNDSVAEISIKDSELCISENADYSVELKSLRTRKGSKPVNTTSFGKDVTDCYIWSAGSVEKKCLVMDGKVYEYTPAGTLVEKCTLSAGKTRIYPFVVYNRLYFGDGNEIFVWGDYDHSSEEGTADITKDQIVRNNDSTSGVKGHFYQAKSNRTGIDLKVENYANTTYWTDVTDVPFYSSSVVRKMQAFDPSKKETVLITVVKSGTAAGSITIMLNEVEYSVSLTTSSNVSGVVTAIKNAINAKPGWVATTSGNVVTCVKTEAGTSANGYVDTGDTGWTITYQTKVEGYPNDCNIDAIKKCTMFLVHTASYRVFATGNPDDNAIYYSEIGKPNYFKGEINKVYAANGFGKPTGITQLSESVLVSFEMGWYAWNGITPLEDASWKPLNIPYGCVCNDSIALTPYSFMFLSNDGIYNISASILNTELFMIQGTNVISKITKNRVDNAINKIFDKKACRAIFHRNTYYLAYNVDESRKNTRVLKYEWDSNSFTEVTGWEVNAWMQDSESLYFATKNYLAVANVTTSDLDVETGGEKPIEFYVKTKEYSFDNPFVEKVVNLIGFIFKQYKEVDIDAHASITVIAGYEKHDIGAINISESLIYGRNWGLKWGFREAVVNMVEFTEASNTFQVEVRNNELNSPITLVGIGFIYEETDFTTPNILKDSELLI